MRILLTNPSCLLDEILEHESHLNRYVGWLNTPKYFGNFRRYLDYDPTMPIAIDNSAFTDFKVDRYEALIRKINVDIAWITAPDVVANAELTQILFNYWRPELKGLPIAFVGQDGAEHLPLPWNRFDCFFIGGSTEWKLSPAAAYLALEAKQRGKLVHMGRVNSDSRLKYAYDLGCDSVDGTGYQRFSKFHLKKALQFMHGLHNQLTMPEALHA